MSSDLAVIATKTVRPCIHHDNNQRSLYNLSIYTINMVGTSLIGNSWYSIIHLTNKFKLCF
jgi:hypothetical protein